MMTAEGRRVAAQYRGLYYRAAIRQPAFSCLQSCRVSLNSTATPNTAVQRTADFWFVRRMSAPRKILLIGVGLLAFVLLFTIPASPKGFSGQIILAAQEARQVGIAIHLFAQDHGGAMPTNLDQLVPNYLPDRRLFHYTRLTTPGATLKTLPKDSMIAFRLVPKETNAVVVIDSEARATHLFLR